MCVATASHALDAAGACAAAHAAALATSASAAESLEASVACASGLGEAAFEMGAPQRWRGREHPFLQASARDALLAATRALAGTGIPATLPHRRSLAGLGEGSPSPVGDPEVEGSAAGGAPLADVAARLELALGDGWVYRMRRACLWGVAQGAGVAGPSALPATWLPEQAPPAAEGRRRTRRERSWCAPGEAAAATRSFLLLSSPSAALSLPRRTAAVPGNDFARDMRRWEAVATVFAAGAAARCVAAARRDVAMGESGADPDSAGAWEALAWACDPRCAAWRAEAGVALRRVCAVAAAEGIAGPEAAGRVAGPDAAALWRAAPALCAVVAKCVGREPP